jgi:hypothetical protein
MIHKFHYRTVLVFIKNINMNYRKIYESIIENARNENRKKYNKYHFKYVYYENHHIFPKCMGGLDNELNTILLTLKEHYICHKPLILIYPESIGVVKGYNMILSRYENNKLKNFKIDFAYSNLMNSVSSLNYYNSKTITIAV